MPIDNRAHLRELVAHTAKLLSGFPQASQAAERGDDPVALDKFRIHCHALAEALSVTGDRAGELAGTLLDR